jgi:hypothetical protein
MIVYHGSYREIHKIDLSLCVPHRDFGKGFYVTKFRKQAEEWAIRIALKHNQNDVGVVTEFVFYESAFTDGVHKVLHFDDYTDEWLDFVILNRRKDLPVPAHDYDIVEGPVANDRISQEIDNFMAGNISREKFLNMLRHATSTHQICFCTADALLMLDPKDNRFEIRFEIAEISYPLVEQLMSDRDIDEMKATDLFFSSQTFGRLADISTQLYQKPWQEIYEMLKEELNN